MCEQIHGFTRFQPPANEQFGTQILKHHVAKQARQRGNHANNCNA